VGDHRSGTVSTLPPGHPSHTMHPVEAPSEAHSMRDIREGDLLATSSPPERFRENSPPHCMIDLDGSFARFRHAPVPPFFCAVATHGAYGRFVPHEQALPARLEILRM